jgi:hypothetical protein
VEEINFGTLFGGTSPLLKGVVHPLEVLELSAEVFKRLEMNPGVKRAGWRPKEVGRRGSIVRDSGFENVGRDNRDTEWRWGASYWGMRKVPVARAKVGGMYDYYMFKR